MRAFDVDVIQRSSELATLESGWKKLVQNAQLPGPFCDYEWQYEWWRALGQGRKLKTFVATTKNGLEAVLPMFTEPESGARGLFLIGSKGGGSDYLTAPSANSGAQRAVIDEALGSDADFVEFEDILWTDSFWQTVHEQAARRGLKVLESLRYPCPYIKLERGFEALVRQSGKYEILRRRRRWLEKQSGFEITCETSARSVPLFLERFFRLHKARWASHGGSEAFSDGRLTSFHHHTAARQADAGILRLWTLHLGKTPAATLWSFDDGSRAVYYQSGFQPEFSNRSVGLVLFAHFIEDACARGLLEVDLLRGSEPYKFEWTKEARVTRRLTIPITERGRRALALREIKNRARAHLREALPPSTRQKLSKALRESRMSGATSLIDVLRRKA